jgi:hypothetical protein
MLIKSEFEHLKFKKIVSEEILIIKVEHKLPAIFGHFKKSPYYDRRKEYY